jgi:predicted peptidase
MIKILYIFIIGLLTSYSTLGKSVEYNSLFEFSLDTLKLYDQSRQREIPIAIYKPTSKVSRKQKLVIFSHGYGQNKGGDYLVVPYELCLPNNILFLA